MDWKTKSHAVLLILISAIFMQCSIDKPVLPKWVVPFVIPLKSEKIVFQEDLANDSTIVTRGDSLYLDIHGEMEPQSITEADLKVPSQESSSSFEVDTLRLDSLNNMTTGFIPVGETIGFLNDSIGKNVTIHQSTFAASPRTISSTEFEKVKVADGRIRVTMENNLPFTLGPNSFSPDGMYIRIFNDSTNTQIAEVNIPDMIPPGGSASSSSPIGNGGSWIYSRLRIEYTLSVAEDTTFQVTQDILNSAGYEIKMGLFDLSVTEIVGKVEPQYITKNIGVELDQENKIISGEIASGSVNLALDNHLAVGAQITASFPDILDETGQPMTMQLDLPPNQTTNYSFALDGHRIQNSQYPGSILDSLVLEMDVETEESDGFVPVKASDNFEATVRTSDLVFQSFTGRLATDTLTIDPFEETDLVDYKGFGKGFTFQGAELTVQLLSQINMENLLANLAITGFHRNDEGIVTDSATIHISDEPLQSNIENIIRLRGPEVDAFLNILPTNLRGSGYIVYGGEAQVQAGDEITGNYSFATPFKVKIENPDPIRIDPDTLYESDIDQDVRDAAGDDIQEAVFKAKLLNHSPLGGEVKIFVCADSLQQDLYDSTSCTDPRLEFIKSARLNKAAVNPSTGFVEVPEENEITFQLNADELRIFKNVPIRVGFLINLEETNDFVVLQGSDFLQISGEFQVSILVKDDN